MKQKASRNGAPEVVGRIRKGRTMGTMSNQLTYQQGDSDTGRRRIHKQQIYAQVAISCNS